MNMKRTLTTIVLSLAALVILSGCGGKVRYPNYYTLNLPVPPDPPASENAHATVAIREFRAPAYLRQGTIVYRPSPEQIGFYAYHRWAIDPCEFVTNSVIERLRASGHFAHVKAYDGRPGIEYVLSGRLDKLEEVDYDGAVYGCELIGDPLGNIRDFDYDFRKLRAGSAVAAFDAKKRAILCKCTHECNTRTMLVFDRANALPVLGAMAGLGGPRSAPPAPPSAPSAATLPSRP